MKQFDVTDVDAELINNRAIEIALNNPEIEITYSRKQLDTDNEVEQLSETYNFKGGFSDYLKNVSESFFEFKYDHEDFTAKYYVILDKHQGIEEKIFVYVNSSLLFEGGTAATMFFNTFFSTVVDKLKSESRKRKIEINKNDIRQNLMVVADVKMKNPRYDNQSKTRLISQEIKKHIDKMVEDGIAKFLSHNKDWIEEVLDRAEFRQKIADMAEVKKRQKKKRGKLAKLIDCYSKERGKCSIAFSEGDCLNISTQVKTIGGYKRIDELLEGEMVETHSGDFKSIVKLKDVIKREYVITLSNGVIISCSKKHKHPVYNSETNLVELVKTKDLQPYHKFLKKK